jgi:transposase
VEIMDSTMEKRLSCQEATDWREGRRLRAFELKQQGWKQLEIAKAVGVSEGAVSQWMKREREGGGIEALKKRTSPGKPPRLSEEQREEEEELAELLARGAEAHGFRGEVWTCQRVAQVIRKEFGVNYHPAQKSKPRSPVVGCNRG